MSLPIPVTITPTSINVLFEGRMRTLNKTHINYARVHNTVRAINTNYACDGLTPATSAKITELKDLLDIPTFIARVTEGRVKLTDNEVYFDGIQVHGVIAQRLIGFLQAGEDIRPLARFLERLMENTNENAVNEMYLWLESGNMPLMDDGCFIAFKKVNADYSSSYRNPDGTPFYNLVGTSPSMPREQVDANRNVTCSTGLHFCSWQYLPEFGMGGEAKVIILRIAPEDVVAIPNDYNNSKGRAWRYTVLDTVPEDECEHLFDGRPVVDKIGLYDNSSDEEGEYADEYEKEVLPEAECEQCGEDDTECDCTEQVADGPSTLDEFGMAIEEVLNQEPVFTHGKRSLTASEVIQLTDDYGQRGVSKMLDLPRTTLQGWIRRSREWQAEQN